MKKYITLLFAICLITTIQSKAQNFDTIQIKTNKITDAIYMLEGAGGNIGVCVGDDGTFIIDDQFAPLTEKIKAAIAEITDNPVRFVINTHFHHDHTGGNENFGKAGAIIVSHKNSRKRIKADQLKRVAEAGKEEEVPIESLPKVTFTDEMTFHHNGETINIFHVHHAHTDGDIIIHFENANVFHMGDVFVRYGFPFIDATNGGNINGMIEGLSKAVEMADDNAQFIPGHGKLGIKKDVIVFRDMLKTIRDRVKAGHDDGKSLEEVIASDPTKGFEERGVDTKEFIKVVYEGVGEYRE